MEICRRTTGFTLVELMVGVAMLSILAGIALPEFRQMTVNVKTKSAAREVYDLLQHGRILAVREGGAVWIQFGDPGSDNTSFSDVVLGLDLNNDGKLTEIDADGKALDEIRERFSFEAPVKAKRSLADGRGVFFNPQGTLTGSAAGVEVTNTLTRRAYALSVSAVGTIDMRGKTVPGEGV
ncbi:GspH/FimT family pseudopilin [Desulfoluna sp.]|uniref:GspH/FimT family pseudopilin n=1 Tax=Desulfoluna sp. TaxID=2045199 RepID=UPI00260C42A7|nr:GspH/FimT family pseudopilin [Desulfoluna sp.]